MVCSFSTQLLLLPHDYLAFSYILFLAQNTNDADTHIPILVDDTVEHKDVLVHQSTIHHDAIKIFMDPNILNCSLDVVVINANGNPEPGIGKGVI